jgi:hypothetical protein
MAKRTTKSNEQPINGITVETDGKSGGNDSVANGDTKSSVGTENAEGGTARVAGFTAVSPIDLGKPIDPEPTGDPSGAAGKRRGRPPGRRAKTETAAADLIQDLTGAICVTNAVLVTLTHCEEFDAPKEQVEEVADKVRNFAQHFSVKLDPVKLAAFQLFVAILIMYAPGVKALWIKNSKPRLAPVAIAPRQSKPEAAEMSHRETNKATARPEVPSQIWDAEPVEDLSLGTQ